MAQVLRVWTRSDSPPQCEPHALGGRRCEGGGGGEKALETSPGKTVLRPSSSPPGWPSHRRPSKPCAKNRIRIARSRQGRDDLNQVRTHAPCTGARPPRPTSLRCSEQEMSEGAQRKSCALRSCKGERMSWNGANPMRKVSWSWRCPWLIAPIYLRSVPRHEHESTAPVIGRSYSALPDGFPCRFLHHAGASIISA